MATYFLGVTLFPYDLYEIFISPTIDGSFFGAEEIGRVLGSLLVAYVFFIPLSFISFSTKYKYKAIVILLIPAIYFIVQVDLSHFWFYILAGLAGWGIGFVIAKIISLVRS